MRLASISDMYFGPRTCFAGKLRKLTYHAGALTGVFVDNVNTVGRPELVIDLRDLTEEHRGPRHDSHDLDGMYWLVLRTKDVSGQAIRLPDTQLD